MTKGIEPGQKINLYVVCTQIGELKGAFEEMSKHLNTTLADHTTRLNDVEEKTDQVVGKISIAGAIAGLIGGAIVNAIGFFLKK